MTAQAPSMAGVLLAAALAAAWVPAAAQNSEFVEKGPSFKCAGVRQVTQKLICRHEELAELDLELDQAFKGALRRTGGAEAARLRRAQLRWVAERNRCEALVECLLTAYYHRLEELAPTEAASRSLEADEREDAGGMNPIADVEAGFEELPGAGAPR